MSEVMAREALFLSLTSTLLRGRASPGGLGLLTEQPDQLGSASSTNTLRANPSFLPTFLNKGILTSASSLLVERPSKLKLVTCRKQDYLHDWRDFNAFGD